MYSENYTKEDCGYLETGFLVYFNKYRLIHYTEPEEDLIFIRHKND